MLLLGVLQAQAAGQVAGSFDLLETQVLTGSAASVTFSSLSTYAADYQHLQIRMAARTTRSSTSEYTGIFFNADTTVTNYYGHQLVGNGSSVTSAGFNEPLGARVPSATNTANSFGAVVMDILDPFSSSKNTTIRTLDGFTGSANSVDLISTFWNNTTAVTSITLDPTSGGSFVQFSRFSLYGIKAA